MYRYTGSTWSAHLTGTRASVLNETVKCLSKMSRWPPKCTKQTVFTCLSDNSWLLIVIWCQEEKKKAGYTQMFSTAFSTLNTAQVMQITTSVCCFCYKAWNLYSSNTLYICNDKGRLAVVNVQNLSFFFFVNILSFLGFYSTFKQLNSCHYCGIFHFTNLSNVNQEIGL